nr:OB-fold putative lipoprotein [Corallococcus sp. EGB]
MRAWWLVAVLAVGGCKKEAGTAPGQTAAPGDAPGPTAKAPAPPPPPAAPALIHVGPRQLWDAYADNEVAADMKYRGKQVEVTGLIQDIAKDATDNILVSLDVGERMSAVMCLVPDGQMQAVAELSKGQLVAFHGTVRGLFLKRPIIKDCRVAWAGPKAKEKVDPKASLHIARSTELCLLTWMTADIMATKSRLPDGGAITEEAVRAALLSTDQGGAIANMEKKARADIAETGETAIPCDAPLLKQVFYCEDDEHAREPACQLRLMKDSQAQLQR